MESGGRGERGRGEEEAEAEEAWQGEKEVEAEALGSSRRRKGPRLGLGDFSVRLRLIRRVLTGFRARDAIGRSRLRLWPSQRRHLHEYGLLGHGALRLSPRRRPKEVRSRRTPLRDHGACGRPRRGLRRVHGGGKAASLAGMQAPPTAPFFRARRNPAGGLVGCLAPLALKNGQRGSGSRTEVLTMAAPTNTSSVGRPARASAAGVFAAASRASCASRSWSSRRRAEDIACMGAPVATRTSPPILTFFAGGPRLSLDRARRSVGGLRAFALPLS